MTDLRLVGIALAIAGTQAHGADAEAIKRGEYLARAGDCVACHTAPGGKPMAGGLSLPTPVGAISSTNITPSKTHGIGNYTLEQFSTALRAGIRADGKHLYPAMPYNAYAKVTDNDVKLLYGYFMEGVAPVDATPPPTNLPFPFNIRLSMAAWNLLFLDRNAFQPDASKDAQWNRGAYLTYGLAHCGACHTPRNVFMAEKQSQELGGGELGPWYAPNITADGNSGVGGWSVQELADYMRLGHTPKAQAAGPMVEAIDNSLRHLTAEDLRSIATFLKSVPALHDTADTRPVYEWGGPAVDFNGIRGKEWPKERDQMGGPELYDAYCASCHQSGGQGSFDGGLPPLFHNSGVGRANTNNLVMVMLEGIQRHVEPYEIRMPGFAKELSDTQLATLGSYLVQRYGNPRAKVTAAQVGQLRAGSGAANLIWAARAGMVLATIALMVAIFLLGRSVRRNKRRSVAR
jgi:mono/diheme cytochrome c family protein